MGTLFQNRGGQNSFKYDESWISEPNATPLSHSLPLTGVEYKNKQINNFLWGLLPDNEKVIERWASQFKVSTGNPIGLLANVGRDVTCAVSFADEPYEDSGGLTPIRESEIEAQIDATNRDPAAWSTPAIGQFSLADEQGKFALRYQDGNWFIPHGYEPTTHIFNPRG